MSKYNVWFAVDVPAYGEMTFEAELQEQAEEMMRHELEEWSNLRPSRLGDVALKLEWEFAHNHRLLEVVKVRKTRKERA